MLKHKILCQKETKKPLNKLVPEKHKSKGISSEVEASSLKSRSIRSETDGGTLSMNCSSIKRYQRLNLRSSPNGLCRERRDENLLNSSLLRRSSPPSFVHRLKKLDSMRGRSYTPSPPRGYGRRGRSPSPRGRYGGRSRDLPTSLLVRNLRHDCRQEDLRRSFEQFGPLKDIYLPRDYYTGDPRGFGFVQFEDPADAADAKYHMDGYLLLGRELTVVFAEENRKKPTEMRLRERGGGRCMELSLFELFCLSSNIIKFLTFSVSRSSRFRDRRRTPPRYYSRSRSPPPRRARSRSRSGGYYSPARRHHPRSISPREERYDGGRSYSRSPAYNGSRGRSVSPARGKSRSISLSPRRSISPSPRRSISRSPRRSRSRSPRRNRSLSPKRSRSNTPDPARSRSQSPHGGLDDEDRSPSQ
ncbi:hypothetical protein CARUB_v10009288mg [Capsella rubella]|uniref:RRM domain-containing protein n=1 Tax=Capsella rubella TaxID=81985 RepID=R0IT47_9BRAS|nr:hypothetical protein CARUB_v10009288mg [Capsella rubella]